MTELQKEEITTTPAGSDTAGVGVGRDIVPVLTASSSDNGPVASCEAGDAAERTTAKENPVFHEGEKPPECLYEDIVPRTHRLNSADTLIIGEGSTKGTPVPEVSTQVHLNWVQEIEADEAAMRASETAAAVPMEIDMRVAIKRKKDCSGIETDSFDSASDAGNKNRVKTRSMKKRIYTKDVANALNCSAPESTQSAQSGTDREDGRNKKKTKKSKQLDPVVVEQGILQVTGRAPDDIEEDLLVCMTAADISATAIEYLQVIDLIRVKSKRLQGALNGELKRRTQCLGSFIRALQVRAEAAGDPLALQRKIEELLEEAKRNRKEEERKQREISLLQDTIKELKQENKQIKIEMRKTFKEIRESLSIDRKGNKDRSMSKEKGKEREERKEDKKEREERKKLVDKKDLSPSPAWPVGQYSLDDTTYPPLDDKEYPPLPQRSGPKTGVEYVPRPAIQGKILMMPVKDESRPIASTSRLEVQAQRTRSDIKIKSNIQVRPPDNLQGSNRRVSQDQDNNTNININTNSDLVKNIQQDWQIADRRGKAIKKKRDKLLSAKAEKEKTIKVIKNKIPKTAAISIKDVAKDFSYAEALRRVRSEVSLKNLNIQMPRVRRGINGSTIIEISGEENAAKADLLANEMQRILKNEARINRPNIKGEIKLYGMDDSITPEEIMECIVQKGKCKPDEVRIGKIGRIRSGIGIVWVQCPKITAVTLAEKEKVQIGWSVVRITLLDKRQIQCHKCWRIGHVQENCKAECDYSTCCFRCGVKGHAASACTNKVSCKVCEDNGLKNNHHMGSPRCSGVTIRVKKAKQLANAEPPSIEMMESEEQSVRRTDNVEMEEL